MTDQQQRMCESLAECVRNLQDAIEALSSKVVYNGELTLSEKPELCIDDFRRIPDVADSDSEEPWPNCVEHIPSGKRYACCKALPALLSADNGEVCIVTDESLKRVLDRCMKELPEPINKQRVEKHGVFDTGEDCTPAEPKPRALETISAVGDHYRFAGVDVQAGCEDDQPFFDCMTQLEFNSRAEFLAFVHRICTIAGVNLYQPVIDKLRASLCAHYDTIAHLDRDCLGVIEHRAIRSFVSSFITELTESSPASEPADTLEAE